MPAGQTPSPLQVRWLPFFLGWFCLGWFCSCQSLSQIVVDIDTDLEVPSELDVVRLTVTGATQTVGPRQIDLTVSDAPTFPLTLGLVPGGALSPVSITAEALRTQGVMTPIVIVSQQAQTEFVEGRSLLLRMLLLSSCTQIVCGAGLTCVDGVCADVHRPGPSLPTFTGKLPARPPPRAVVTPIGGRSIWAAGNRTCAVDGPTLYCWGQNADGQLGIGTTQTAVTTRQTVMTLGSPSAIGLGLFHSCACDSAGQAFCWGRNTDGQLGTGNTALASRPVAVRGLTDCVAIAGGAQHTCGLRQGGVVWCWGGNAKGQLGQGAPTATPVTMPRLVPGLSEVVEVGAGDRSTCARLMDATIWCWGDNASGQLGDGTTKDHASPAQVVGLPADIVELAVSRLFVCVRRATGQILCWGDNTYGQLGNGTKTTSSIPVEVAGVADATQIAPGGAQHVCIVRRSGRASCWGGNMFGQFGDGTLVGSLVPVDVTDISGVVSLSAGSTHTCARHSMGLGCWGQNTLSQLGEGTMIDRDTPISVAGFPSSFP